LNRRTILRLLTCLALVVPLQWSPKLEAQSSCQPVFDAITKVVTTPSHSYTTQSAATGNPRSTETIYTANKIYARVNGKWMDSSLKPSDVLAQEKENRQHTKASCQVVRSEVVGTEAATLYSMHSENEDTKTDAQMWISKSTGLPLREETDISDVGSAEKRHASTRYEYSNVKAPI